MTPTDKRDLAVIATFIATSIPVAWALIACFTPIDLPPQWLAIPAGLASGALWARMFCDVYVF
jgi:hypothetical protein